MTLANAHVSSLHSVQVIMAHSNTRWNPTGINKLIHIKQMSECRRFSVSTGYLQRTHPQAQYTQIGDQGSQWLLVYIKQRSECRRFSLRGTQYKSTRKLSPLKQVVMASQVNTSQQFAMLRLAQEASQAVANSRRPGEQVISVSQMLSYILLKSHVTIQVKFS